MVISNWLFDAVLWKSHKNESWNIRKYHSLHLNGDDVNLNSFFECVVVETSQVIYKFKFPLKLQNLFINSRKGFIQKRMCWNIN